MHVRVCGWCAAPFQVLERGPSTPQRPTHSHQVSVVCIPPKGGGKGKGKKQVSSTASAPRQAPLAASAPPKGKGAGNPAAPSQPKREPRDSSAGSVRSSGAGMNGTFWQKRLAAAKERERSTPKVDPPAPPSVATPMESEEAPASKESEEAQELLEQMDTVQAMLNSLAGRHDPYSAASREHLEKELGSLRIQRTKTKSLTAQVAVLEALVARRTAAILEAEDAILEAQQHCQTLRQELTDVTAQLSNVVALKMQEDVSKVPPLVANALGPISLLSHAQEMAAMLPKDKAAIFSECIGLLAQMIAPQVGAPSAPSPTVVVDLVSQSMATEAQSAANMDASLFAFGTSGFASTSGQQSAAASSSGPATASTYGAMVPTGKGSHLTATSDPYGRTTSPVRRGRAQSAAPSPQQRSRSTSIGGRRLRCKTSPQAVLALGPAIAPFPVVPVAGAVAAVSTFSCVETVATNLG